MNKDTPNLLKFVLAWDSKEDECTEEFLYSIRGKMAFDIEREFPLLKNIGQHDLEYNLSRRQFEGKYYHLTFSEEFKRQIDEYYPEHLI